MFLALCYAVSAIQQQDEHLALQTGDTITGSIGSEFVASSPIECSRRYYQRIVVIYKAVFGI